MSLLDPRLQDLVDDRLFNAYWESVTHFRTKDLVLIFNGAQDVDPVSAAPRERLLSDPELPEAIRSKLQKPASEAAAHLKSSDASFWLVAAFDDNEMVIAAINAKPVALGGHA